MFTGIIIGVAVLAAAIIYFEIRAPYIKRKTAPLVHRQPISPRRKAGRDGNQADRCGGQDGSGCGKGSITMKVLFICKRRNTYYGISYGLLNSAEFVSGMLGSIGVDSKVVVVNDNNDIDREVTKMEWGLEGISKEGPRSIVIIEALWVVPEKFDILKQLHPNVEWIVRIHSKSSFLASEGIAMDWINRYFDKGVRVAFNNIDTRELFASTFSRDFLSFRTHTQ